MHRIIGVEVDDLGRVCEGDALGTPEGKMSPGWRWKQPWGATGPAGTRFGPASSFLAMPSCILKRPVGSTIAPQEEVDLKPGGAKVPQSCDEQTQLLARNQNPKVSVPDKANVKTNRDSSKASMKRKPHRGFS
ncbi:hypothetical protein GUJ93_ZPchr0004g38771 [Zizania palustris]|uniref:Uncharacterized protein n=1 Tax=Zizania palustris TaxID=103762 RepID=A0A8J5SCZ3_ZIZPA|nr:hypothetical protein GUJ93_ZPchr0004g38771 [Zizania palustris]